MMIFGTPVSWFITEILSMVLLFVCMAHMAKQENPELKIFEFIAFIILAGSFENIGVYCEDYIYDTHRILMFGKVPISILIIEASIFYMSFGLTEYLNMPVWAKPVVVGLFSSVQDITIDASYVNDTHLFDGVLSGQWNWKYRYDGGIAGVPYHNFSGWFTMMMFFAIAILLGRWLYRKHNRNRIIGYLYPFGAILLALLLIISPINVFLINSTPIFPMNQEIPGLVMLILKYAVGVAILIIYRNRIKPVNIEKDWLYLVLPMVLHVYDLIYAFAAGITIAYAPCIIVTAIHGIYLWIVYMKSLAISEAGRSGTA